MHELQRYPGGCNIKRLIELLRVSIFKSICSKPTSLISINISMYNQIDQQIMQLLNEHIVQNQQYVSTAPQRPPWVQRDYYEERKHKKKDKKAHSHQRSRSRSVKKKKNHHHKHRDVRDQRESKGNREQRSYKPDFREIKSKTQYNHHKKSRKNSSNRRSSSPSLKFSDDAQMFSDSEPRNKPRDRDEEFFRKIVGDEHPPKPATFAFDTHFEALTPSPIKKRWIPDQKPHEDPTTHLPQKIPLMEPLPPQLNPLEVLVLQKKRMMSSNRPEPDLQLQQKLLEDLLQPKTNDEYQKRRVTYQREPGSMIEMIGGKVPVFPINVPESKRDQYLLEWWKTVSNHFFTEPDKLDTSILNPSKFVESQKWYDSQPNEEMQAYSQTYDCYEPLVFTHYSLRDTINVLTKTTDTQSLISYKFEPVHEKKYDKQLRLSLPQCSLRSSSGKNLQTKDERSTHYKEHYGYELTFAGSMPIQGEEYQECLNLGQEIEATQQYLQNRPNEDEFTQQTPGNLEISYQVLRKQLQEVIKENNSMKCSIMSQMQYTPIDMTVKIKEQHLLMDRLRWQQVISYFQRGYCDKGPEVLNCFYKLPSTVVSAKKEKQKGLVKMQTLLSKRNNKPLDTDCKVCFNNETSEINPVIYCDRCQTSFHRLCYGVQGLVLDQQEFFCDGCKLLDRGQKGFKPEGKPSLYKHPRKVVCQICNKLGLPQKLMKNKFYHVACLIITNQILFEEGSYAFRGGVTTTSIQQMVEENESTLAQCALCGNFKGYKLQCSNITPGIPCRHAMHPMCAYLNGIKMDVVLSDSDSLFPRVTLKVTCALHMEENFNNQILQVYYRRYVLNLDQTAKLGGFERFIEKYEKSSGYNYLLTKSPLMKRPKSIHQDGVSNEQREGSSNEL